MQVSLDIAGRLVLPKAIVDALGLLPGQTVEISTRDGRIEIEPAAIEVSIEERDGMPVLVPTREVPTMTRATVRELIETLRLGSPAR